MNKDSEKISSMFDSIAPKYDRLNRILSLRIDVRWRKKTVKQVDASGAVEVLDVATGTGDLALAMARSRADRMVTGVDISQGMLRISAQKIERAGLGSRISVRHESALAMSFPDDCFDAATIGFGVRNFENTVPGLTEICRVLRPGGRLFVLEFSTPRGFLAAPYFFYFRYVLPLIGRMVSKNSSAYTYLPESVLEFPCGEAFGELMRQGGFTNISYQTLSGGIATLYVGQKPMK